MREQDKAMLASYARSLVGALVAVYSTGTTDPRAMHPLHKTIIFHRVLHQPTCLPGFRPRDNAQRLLEK